MKIFKLIYFTFIQLGKQVWMLPKNIEKAVKQRQRQVMLKAREVERLDRIRNPSNYQGK